MLILSPSDAVASTPMSASSMHTHEIARWPTLRDEFPLPAERGEGQGEGCLGNTRSFSGNVFKAFSSPRPSPRSLLAGRGRRRSAARSPCLCRLSCGLLCSFARLPRPARLALAGLSCSLLRAGAEPPAELSEQPWNWHVQNTEVVQYHPGFSARYSGPNSLRNVNEVKETVSLDLFAGLRVWPGAEAHVDGLVWQGFGLSKSEG